MLKVMGDREFAARLITVAGPGMDRAAKRAASKAIKIVEAAEKAAAPSNPGGSIRGSIGSSVKRLRGGIHAKAGAAVGKRINRIRTDTRRGANRGVGISARNIHWYVMGTAPRQTGSVSRRNKLQGRYRKPTGKAIHSTGMMPAHPFIRAAAQSALPEAARILQLDLQDALRAEWKKAGGK